MMRAHGHLWKLPCWLNNVLPVSNRPTLASLKASRMTPGLRLNLTHFCR